MSKTKKQPVKQNLSKDDDSDDNEDDQICHLNRIYLENQGIKFAPVEVARYFSFERELSNIKTFGFHGDFNFERLGV
jgi:hypothetical protein